MQDNCEYEVSLDPEDKAKIGSDKLTWLKFLQKQQTILAAFVYFHTVDANAIKAARRANKAATTDDLRAAASKALNECAAVLNKPAEQLTIDEKLDLSAAQFKSFRAHYLDGEGNGYFLSRLGLDGPESDAIWKRLDEPRQYFTTLILVYPTTREGKHDADAISTTVGDSVSRGT
jgi:hypothetical protein